MLPLVRIVRIAGLTMLFAVRLETMRSMHRAVAVIRLSLHRHPRAKAEEASRTSEAVRHQQRERCKKCERAIGSGRLQDAAPVAATGRFSKNFGPP